MEGQGNALWAGLTASLGRLQRSQERLEKQVGALSVAAPHDQGRAFGFALAGPAPERPGKADHDSLNQAQARPSRQELEAAKRIAELGKRSWPRVKEAGPRPLLKADPKLSARLRSLEKQQAADNKDERVIDRRLDQLEKKVSTVAAQAKARPVSGGQARSTGGAQAGAHHTFGASLDRPLYGSGPQLWGEDEADQGVEPPTGRPRQALHRGEAGDRGQEVSLDRRGSLARDQEAIRP